MISKHTNTSYKDTEEITPMERTYLLQFIIDDLTKQKEILDAVKNSNKKRG